MRLPDSHSRKEEQDMKETGSVPHRSRSVIATLTAIVVLTAACGGASVPPTSTPTQPIPTEVPTSAATQEPTPTPFPGLTQEALGNADYPSEWAVDGVAHLTDGVYREEAVPSSATELVIELTRHITNGDLNDDGAEDTAVIVIADPGGSGTFYTLVPVLNEGGIPRPLAPQYLGDRVIIRALEIKDGDIVVEMVGSGPEDPLCCPTDSKQITYRLEGDTLVEVDVIDLPDL